MMYNAVRIFCKTALSAALVMLCFIAGALAGETRIVMVTGVVYPGQQISQEMLREVTLRKPLRTNQRVVLDASEIVGKVAKRTLLPRRAIPVAALRQAYVVEAGRPVRAVFVNGGLSITIMVVALMDGATGDMVKVRNPDSGRTFAATARSDGTVMVGPL